jgi:hypothetical protein
MIFKIIKIIIILMMNLTFDIHNIDDIHLVHTFKTPLILKVWTIIEIMIYLLMRYNYI